MILFQVTSRLQIALSRVISAERTSILQKRLTLERSGGSTVGWQRGQMRVILS